MADNYSPTNMDPGNYLWYNPQSLGAIAKDSLSGVNNNNAALIKNREEALRTGPSAWRGLMDKTIQSNERQGLDQAANRSAGQQAQAESALAMRGGLSSGARERLTRNNSNNYLNMAQDVSNQAQNAGYNADTQDENNRVKQLSMQPGMENAATDVDLRKAQMNIGANQYDIGNQISSYDKLNMFNANKYKSNMEAWAAGQQAQATQNSGKK